MTDVADSTRSDIAEEGWIARFVPKPARPFLILARFDRPIGTWLLLLPCWWGTALAADGWPDPWFLLLFAVGAAVMRGAGCTFNDIVDRDFDARVARTAARPIPSGQVTVWGAVVFLILQALIGLVVLLQFNRVTVIVGVCSLLLVAVYPFMKRITYWPQAVLGLTFNWGALLGWTAVHGSLDTPALALYAAGLFWTLGYDTVYAHQDKEDDLLVGVKSSALRLGHATRPWLFVFYALAIGLLGFAGVLAGLAWPFFAALAAAALHAAWQAGTVGIDDPADCLRKFKSNRDFGLIVFVGVVLGRILG